MFAFPARPAGYQIERQLRSFVGGLNFGRKKLGSLRQSDRPVRVSGVAIEAVQGNRRGGIDDFQ